MTIVIAPVPLSLPLNAEGFANTADQTIPLSSNAIVLTSPVLQPGTYIVWGTFEALTSTAAGDVDFNLGFGTAVGTILQGGSGSTRIQASATVTVPIAPAIVQITTAGTLTVTGTTNSTTAVTVKFKTNSGATGASGIAWEQIA